MSDPFDGNISQIEFDELSKYKYGNGNYQNLATEKKSNNNNNNKNKFCYARALRNTE